MDIVRLVMLGAAVLLPGVAIAEGPKPFPDFTFKMGKPPASGATPRIDVQIEPSDQAVAQEPDAEQPAAPVAPTSAYGWFWERVSPALAADGTERMRRALQSLSDGPGGAAVAGPRLQTIQSIARAQGAHVLQATIGTNVSPALVLAVIVVESGGARAAESPKGARGLMQLMPDTAARFGVADSLSAPDNIRGGVAYLDWLLGEFEGDAVMALAGYNAGENAVKAHEGVPPFAETRDYVPKVLAAFEVARALCKTRPELITDGCALDLALN